MSVLLGLLSGCGKKKDEKYASPSFDKTYSQNEHRLDEDVEAEYNEASYGDAAVAEKKEKISFRLPTPPTPVPAYCGYYSDTAYANPFLNLAFDGAGTEWYFYDTAKLAAATGQTEDEVTNFREGIRTPYDYETAYYAIMYTRTTASNIIISSINPDKYKIEGLSAGSYMKSVATKNGGRMLTGAHFLNRDCYVVDIPEAENGVGRRVQYAFDHDDLIILITLTLQKEDKLEDILARFTTLE